MHKECPATTNRDVRHRNLHPVFGIDSGCPSISGRSGGVLNDQQMYKRHGLPAVRPTRPKWPDLTNRRYHKSLDNPGISSQFIWKNDGACLNSHLLHLGQVSGKNPEYELEKPFPDVHMIHRMSYGIKSSFIIGCGVNTTTKSC